MRFELAMARLRCYIWLIVFPWSLRDKLLQLCLVGFAGFWLEHWWEAKNFPIDLRVHKVKPVFTSNFRLFIFPTVFIHQSLRNSPPGVKIIPLAQIGTRRASESIVRLYPLVINTKQPIVFRFLTVLSQWDAVVVISISAARCYLCDEDATRNP